MIGLYTRDNGRCNEKRLLLFRIRLDQPDLLPLLTHGVALLRNAGGVSGYHRVSCIYNDLCRTVVLLQTEDMMVRIVLLEVQDILDLGSAECIDGLRIVTYHA